MRRIFGNFLPGFFVALAFLGYFSCFIVSEREEVLVVRFGEIVRDVKEPGIYLKLPAIEAVVRIDKRLALLESSNQSVQVVDSRRYIVDTITMYRVVDAEKFRQSVQANFDLAQQLIKTRVDAALRETYGRRTFQAAFTIERGVMMREIRDRVRDEAKEIGIDIVDVRIRRTDLPPDVLDQTYKRMQAERKAEAEQIRAIGNQQKLTIMAKADRDYTVTLAQAQRDSEIARGNGEAERGRIFAEAAQQDPEFYAFYRSMKAYSKSLSGESTGFVLNPRSDFLKYLETAKPK